MRVSGAPASAVAADLALRVTFIEQAPLFRGLTRGQWLEVAGEARDRRLKRHQKLFREDAPASEVFVLGAGRLKLTQLTPSGEEIIARLVGPGELVGTVGHAAGSAPSGTVTALEPSHALAWDAARFEALLDRLPSLRRNALRIMAERLRHLEDRYRELATEKVPQRLAHALIRLLGQVGRPEPDGVCVALSREELAQLTGTTLFTVSRLLSDWETRRILVARREAVVVRDANGLVCIAEHGVDTCPLVAAGALAPLPPTCPLRR